MADDTILTPGNQNNTTVDQPEQEYLLKNNFLSEYETEEEKSVVRENLNIPSKDNVYSKQDTDIQISEKIKNAIQNYLNADDPHGIIPKVSEMIVDMVKTDGSTPFTQPQIGIDPLLNQHLTTKRYVDKLLRDHLNTDDPHNTLDEIATILEKYAKLSEIYTKTQLYTKQEINTQLKDYIRKDGTTPFTKAQIGIDPQIDSHLSTKRYVDKTLYNHLTDIDPHNFLSILNNRLASYAKKDTVLDKSQTYSRTQIDTIINKLVSESIEQYINEYVDSTNDKIQDIYKQHYIKRDGSVPFINPQYGVDAEEESQLATLGQVNKSVNDVEQNIKQLIDQSVWVTSGNIKTTVGFMEDNTPVPQSMTLQELADAIFYGKRISIEVPKYVILSNSCQINVSIHGDSVLMTNAEVYQDGTLIYTIDRDQLVDGCITLQSNPINSDTIFTLKVYYSNGTVAEDTAQVLCNKPIFVGLLPKWKFANTITMDYLIELAVEDVHGTQNRFINEGKDVSEISFQYKFEDSQLRHPFIVLPKDYPDLDGIVTSNQKFGIESFNIISDIPLNVNNTDIIYKIYVYKQALASLDSSITFKFTENESIQ